MTKIDDISDKWQKRSVRAHRKWQETWSEIATGDSYVERLSEKFQIPIEDIEAGHMAKAFRQKQFDSNIISFSFLAKVSRPEAKKKWGKNLLRALTEPADELTEQLE